MYIALMVLLMLSIWSGCCGGYTVFSDDWCCLFSCLRPQSTGMLDESRTGRAGF